MGGYTSKKGGKKEPRDRPSQGWERDLGLCAGFGQQARQETGRKKGTSDTVLTAGVRRGQKQKRMEVSSWGAWREGGRTILSLPIFLNICDFSTNENLLANNLRKYVCLRAESQSATQHSSTTGTSLLMTIKRNLASGHAAGNAVHL